MNKDQLWKVALGQLELKVSRGNFLTWFQTTKIKEKRDGKVLIETPTAFTHEWLLKKYHHSILEVLQSLDSTIKEVNFCIKSRNVSPYNKPLRKSFRILARKIVKSSVIKEKPVESLSSVIVQKRTRKLAQTLNPKYTFDNYVVGSSNEIAHAACRAVSSRPGETYNPLFIYGGVGLGKTHLLQAIGNEILRLDESALVLYVTSEKFINDFVQSIREHKTQLFKQQYRDIDVLIVDDVQFLAGKEKTQEELFHTYNALHSQNKQVVLSSDRSPSAIATFEERLKSRLVGGMMIDIQQPDYETRLAIVREKAQQKGKNVPDDSLAFIAKNFQKNVRELEGALNRVLAYCELGNQKATLSLTKRTLESALEKPQQKIVDSQSIIKTIGLYYTLPIDDLCGKSRKQEIVRPRQIAMYLLRKENNVSFPTIGDYFGGRDHTTAMHACDKIEKLLEHDEELLREINFIKERLYA